MSDQKHRHLRNGENMARRRKTQRTRNRKLPEGFCILSPRLEVLEIDVGMRKRLPKIDLKKHPLCYQIFFDPPRQEACLHCPSIRTLRDGKVHRTTLKISSGNGSTRVRATAVPVKNAGGEIFAAVEQLQIVSEKSELGDQPEADVDSQRGTVSNRPQSLPEALERGFRQEAEKLRTLLERRKRWGLSFQYIAGEKNRKLRAFLETTYALTSSLDRERVLKIIGDKASELLEADGCTIYLLDSRGKKLRPIFSNELNLADRVLAFELRVGEGLGGKVARSGVAMIINHAEQDEEICVQVPGTPVEPECLISAPLITREKVVGVMTLNRKGEKEFQKKDLELLTIFANQVSGIVENAQLYNRLKESEERYRGIFENNMDILYIADSEGIILEINPAGLKSLGLRRRRAIGRRLDSLFVNPAERAVLNQQLRTKGFIKNIESQISTRGGMTLDVLETSTALRGSDGTIIGFTGIIRDITERKKLQEELIQSQKLEAIGQLAGGVAHDFNNLLAGILGYASYAKSLISPNSKLCRTLDMIQKSSEKAADLTRQLLGFSRRAKYQMEAVNVNELVSEVLKLIGRTINKNVVVEQKLDPRLPPVEADATQIQQAVLNLCLNANDAMASAGGCLQLETKSIFLEKADASQFHLNSSPGRYIQISIADTGVGMDEVTRGRIFEPFFTTKGKGKGTGLGLALAYGIVKSHGGGITCYSEQGCGTTFHIYLPVSKEAAYSPKNKRRSKDMELPPGQETVLVVDDEEVIRHLAKDVLKSLGYQVILAANGKEAIRQYEENSDSIALVILDMIMPQMAGGETYARLREINPNVKVVLSSGYARDGAASRLLKEGAANFIQKPYTMGSLAQVVRQTLDT
jgi:two-component system cell cycle sensor histidine kinase/response regulator CckA